MMKTKTKNTPIVQSSVESKVKLFYYMKKRNYAAAMRLSASDNQCHNATGDVFSEFSALSRIKPCCGRVLNMAIVIYTDKLQFSLVRQFIFRKYFLVSDGNSVIVVPSEAIREFIANHSDLPIIILHSEKLENIWCDIYDIALGMPLEEMNELYFVGWDTENEKGTLYQNLYSEFWAEVFGRIASDGSDIATGLLCIFTNIYQNHLRTVSEKSLAENYPRKPAPDLIGHIVKLLLYGKHLENY